VARSYCDLPPAFFFAASSPTPQSTLFPYTTLFRSLVIGAGDERVLEQIILATLITHPVLIVRFEPLLERLDFTDPAEDRLRLCLDRKSTRLNSSHVKISYAVFCLKKKRRDELRDTI